MRLDRIGEMMHVDDRALHTGFRQAVERMVDERLAGDSISGFGTLSVTGRMRWPRPAAKTMAVVGSELNGIPAMLAATERTASQRCGERDEADACHTRPSAPTIRDG